MTRRKLPIMPLMAIVFLSCCGPACARREVASSAAPAHPANLTAGSGIGIEWVRYYEALGVSARTKRNLLMLYFIHESCEPCEMMDKWTFADPRVVEAVREFVPVKVRGDIEIQMVRRFKVQTFPMLIFVEATEGEIDRKAGYRDADFLLEWVDNVRQQRLTMRALEESLERKPENVELLTAQAYNYLDADEAEQAIELAYRAADIAPGDPQVLSLFGYCYLRLDRYGAAEAAAEAALMTEPANEKARRLKVIILLKKAEMMMAEKDYSAAIRLFEEVRAVDPDNFDALIGMGRAHAEAGKRDEAFAVFRKAADLRPSSPVPHLAMGELYQQAFEDASAEHAFLKALQLEPRFESPYFRLMELYERNGRLDDLMLMYERVLPIDPAGTHNEIAWLLATSKHPHIFDPESAVKHAITAVEMDPRPWYIDTLAEAYYAKGEYSLAINIIKEAMAKRPHDMEYYQEQLEKFVKAKKQTDEPVTE